MTLTAKLPKENLYEPYPPRKIFILSRKRSSLQSSKPQSRLLLPYLRPTDSFVFQPIATGVGMVTRARELCAHRVNVAARNAAAIRLQRWWRAGNIIRLVRRNHHERCLKSQCLVRWRTKRRLRVELTLYQANIQSDLFQCRSLAAQCIIQWWRHCAASIRRQMSRAAVHAAFCQRFVEERQEYAATLLQAIWRGWVQYNKTLLARREMKRRRHNMIVFRVRRYLSIQHGRRVHETIMNQTMWAGQVITRLFRRLMKIRSVQLKPSFSLY